MRLRRLTMAIAGIIGISAAVPASLTLHGVRVQAAGPITFSTPTPGNPDVHLWQGATLDSPLSASSIATTALTTACDPKLCEDTKLTVPAGLATSTLYVKTQWTHVAWKLYMSVIEPDGATVHGGGYGCDAALLQKGCGNETTQAFDEVTIPNPKAGTWTVRVIAVNIHNEAYTGIASLTASSPVQYAKETLAQLTSHLTRTQRVNLVFAGWTPTAQEIKDMQGSLTTQHQPAVAQKQSGDCGDAGDSPGSGLVQGGLCHYTGTDPTQTTSTSTVPYFEPVKFNMDYHFIQADDVWTKDLYATMQAATKQDQAMGPGRIPFTFATAPFKTSYLTAYNAKFGQYRTLDGGADHTATTTQTIDMIDAFTTEDWIQNHRLDPKYCSSFTDLTTRSVGSGAFINPDPTATRDPAWNQNGTSAVNVDRDPQGANTGLTFFFLDTWSPAYAATYFRPSVYHSFSTFDHVKDPDTGGSTPQDNMRGFGGRYRFQFIDLGAAPSVYERTDWVSANVNPEDGNAFFDPPIWQWHQDPQWSNPTLANGGGAPLVVPGVGQVPYHYAGTTLGGVLGYEVTMGLGYKYVGSYLYRPIPNDVYLINTLQVIDHYSLPPTAGGQDLYTVNLDVADNPTKSLAGVSTAAPYDYFSPSGLQHITAGCAANRFVLQQVNNLTTGGLVSDPTCTAPDGLQQSIENGKADALGTGAFAYVVNQDDIRDYIDHHRQQYAPLVNGAFSVPVFNVMFEKQFNVALPLLAGGVASSVNGGEGWGQFDNVNDNLVPNAAIDCANSVPTAPGCNGIPDAPFRHDYYLSYVVIHETSHFIGLNHPHDGAILDTKAADGSWTYEASGLKWLYDETGSPTTYGFDYAQYEAIDQARLMYGHAAEYLKQSQDWLADAYWTDGAYGATSPSANTLSRVTASHQYRDLSSVLFQFGDYLHSQYAMKDAAFYAKGISTPQVAPHLLSLQEASTDTNAIFAIHPQSVYSIQGCATGTQIPTTGTTSTPVISGTPTGLANTSALQGGTAAPAALAVVGIGAVAWIRRRRTEAGDDLAE